VNYPEELVLRISPTESVPTESNPEEFFSDEVASPMNFFPKNLKENVARLDGLIAESRKSALDIFCAS